MAEVLVKAGMKNRFRLKKSDFENIPSIKEVVLGVQPDFYEAYVYLIKDLITGMMYIGLHKKNDKVYWTSMKHKEGLKILQGSEARIEYKILAYGDYGRMRNLEADLIDKHDAVRNEFFWNQMKGISHKESLRMDVVKQIVSDIKNGKYPINEELVSDLINLPTYQVRENEYDPNHLKKIKAKIQGAGNTHKNTNPIIILNNRLNSDLYDEVDLRIDGAHTLKAAESQGCIYGKTIRIPEEVHKDLSHSEVERIASLLNKDPEIPKLPNSNEDLAKILFGTWLRSRAAVDCDANIDFLKEQGKESPDRKNIFKKADELVKAHKYESDKNVVLIDYKEADKKLLKNEEKVRETTTSITISQSSSSLRWDRACERIQDDEFGRKHLVYIVYHSSFTAAENEWDGEHDKLVHRLNKWLVPQGYTYEIVVMPHEREKVKF